MFHSSTTPPQLRIVEEQFQLVFPEGEFGIQLQLRLNVSNPKCPLHEYGCSQFRIHLSFGVLHGECR